MRQVHLFALVILAGCRVQDFMFIRPTMIDSALLADSMMPDAVTMINVGFPTPFPGTQMMVANDLFAFPITVAADEAGQLSGWGVRSVSGSSGVQIRMAIYSNSGPANEPATLLTQSESWILTNEVQRASNFYINPGDYWLLISTSGAMTIGRSTVSPFESMYCYRSLQFSIAFPNSWGNGTCFAANPINIFIQILHPSA